MDKILLSGLEFFGRHGCHAAEVELGQRFLVDIELECDLTRAGETDSLDDTINYVEILQAAREIIEGEPAKLLEHLARRIADYSLKDARVRRARVRIRKPHVAMPCPLDYLGVEIVREQSAQTFLQRDDSTEYV
ncbi:MAG TPA: dihydroneopterin aldolase [Abditibacteriaceae bacterium]